MNKKEGKNLRKVSVIKDVDGNNIVMINDIIFKGKRTINWEDVKIYLKQYVSDLYTIAELIEIATNCRFTENKKEKHDIDAANGWYRYDSRFALPVYGSNEEIERYNVFHVNMIIRHDKNGKKYLYDIINIKKETSNPLSC